MRIGAMVLALLLAGCGGPDGGEDAAAGGANAAVGRPDLPEAGATLALSAAGPGGCSAKWDGAAVTREQLLDRAGAAIDRALAGSGRGQNISVDAIPVVRVEAPADLSFACVDTMLSAVQRAGFPKLILAPAGAAEPELASFPLTEIGPPPPAVVVRIGAGGRMTWNNEAVDAAGLTDRAQRMVGPDARLAPPGEVEIRPTREASFGAVHAALAALRQGNVQATLLPPSVEPRPRPPMSAGPAPALPPPPAVGTQTNSNEAAPAPPR